MPDCGPRAKRTKLAFPTKLVMCAQPFGKRGAKRKPEGPCNRADKPAIGITV